MVAKWAIDPVPDGLAECSRLWIRAFRYEDPKMEYPASAGAAQPPKLVP